MFLSMFLSKSRSRHRIHPVFIEDEHSYKKPKTLASTLSHFHHAYGDIGWLGLPASQCH